MNRRDLLKLIPGAAVVAMVPLPAHVPKTQVGRCFRKGSAYFIELRMDRPVRRAELLMQAGLPIGIAMHDARAGDLALIQVYGRQVVRAS